MRNEAAGAGTNKLSGCWLKEVAGDHLCSLPPTEWEQRHWRDAQEQTVFGEVKLEKFSKHKLRFPLFFFFFPQLFLCTEGQLMVRTSQHLTATEQQRLLM